MILKPILQASTGEDYELGQTCCSLRDGKHQFKHASAAKKKKLT